MYQPTDRFIFLLLYTKFTSHLHHICWGIARKKYPSFTY